MQKTKRTDSVRRMRRHWCSALRQALAVALAIAAGFVGAAAAARAHEGHDHDKPAPLNLPVAPRVVAVTPDYELVGVLSGEKRLTIFLHRFETGEPVKGARLAVSSGESEVEAVRKEDGVFEVSAPWIAGTEGIDIVFKLTLPGDQDILTGRLERARAGNASAGFAPSSAGRQQVVYVGIGALVTGVVLSLLISGMVTRRRHATGEALPEGAIETPDKKPTSEVRRLRRSASALFVLVVASVLFCPQVMGQTAELPSVPATMATDMPQRMPDGSLFVPKATQHLLSVRTVIAAEAQAPRTMRLVGTVIADPNSFGRVQTGHAGRVEAPEGGLAYLGKRVEKGHLLAYLQHHIEAYNKGNLQGELAELEERIKLQETKLAIYLKAPLAIPPIKIEETKGELAALRQKRRELLPTLSDREEIRAPISGVVSVSNVVAGQVVDAREIMFEIVDPARFWVEAIAHDPNVASNPPQAFAVTGNGVRASLEFAGLGPSLKQQAAPLMFRVTGQVPAQLSVGAPVTVIVQSTHETRGIVLPASSVVRSQSGLPVVWVKTEPERFEPHTVRYEPLDGQQVVVSAGLKADMRVVSEGATLLNQIR